MARLALTLVFGLNVIWFTIPNYLWKNVWDSGFGFANVRHRGPIRYADESCSDIPGVMCGHFVVPKSYLDPDVHGFTLIAFARYPAQIPKQQKTKGTVFLNPGGPGIGGKSMVTQTARYHHEIIGPEWDLIAFDPRGTGDTIPNIRCFPSHSDYRIFTANTVMEHGITIPSSNLTSASLHHDLVTQYRELMALQKTQSELCMKTMGDELKYSGTATVVRDIEYMARFFDVNKKINIYTGSYGSIIGASIASMFPDKAGFISVDGIVDPVLWTTSAAHKWPAQWLVSTEETYQWFLRDCFEAGLARCPLASESDKSSEDIESRINGFLQKLAETPLSVIDGHRAGYLTSGGVRSVMLSLLERPIRWQHLSIIMASAISSNNGTDIFNILVPPLNTLGLSHSKDLARVAVSCVDSHAPSSTLSPEDLADEALRALEVSKHFGVSLLVGEPDGGCQFWNVTVPEKLKAPFGAELERPMLILTNTADPITPFESAQTLHSIMHPNSSVLVIQDAPGHTTNSVPAVCPKQLIRKYFAGEAIENGTTCERSGSMFPERAGSSKSYRFGPNAEDLDRDRDTRLRQATWAVAEMGLPPVLRDL